MGEKIIEEVLDGFDFEAVHRVMTEINWVWGFVPRSRVPTVAELRQAAREKLETLHEAGGSIVSTESGGLRAERRIDGEVRCPRYSLAFVLRQSSAVDYANPVPGQASPS